MVHYIIFIILGRDFKSWNRIAQGSTWVTHHNRPMAMVVGMKGQRPEKRVTDETIHIDYDPRLPPIINSDHPFFPGSL